MSDRFLDQKFPGGHTREEPVDLPTIWTVQQIDTGEVVAVCVDHATATWWVSTFGKKGVGYDKIGHRLTVMGIPQTIKVRRMEVARDGTPRVL